MCQVAKPVPWKTILLASSQVSLFWGWGWSGRWRLSFNYIYLFPFVPQTFPTPPLLSFKSMASFFTNGYCMNIWTYMYFSKCNTLSPYNATCMYASRAEPGALRMACSSLGKVTSQNLSVPRLLYSSLCRAEALWVFPGGVRQVHRCHPSSAHVWAGILVGPSDITRRCSHSSLPDPPALSIFLFHFCMSPESWVQSNFFLRL